MRVIIIVQLKILILTMIPRMPLLPKGRCKCQRTKKGIRSNKETQNKNTKWAFSGFKNVPCGSYNISGVLIRGKGMDRNGMKKYIQFLSQNILVTKTCHPAPFSLTRILSPPIP